MKKLLLLVLVLSVGILTAGCSYDTKVSDLQQSEQKSVADNQDKMNNTVPLPTLNNSLERQNIKNRLEMFDDQNRISYIYLVSFGKVMSFYTVKGKITSGNKRLTSTERTIEDCAGVANCAKFVVESPELDGTYGASSPYIFFWTTDGIYVQWSGEYMLSSEPLKLTTQPELIRQVE